METLDKLFLIKLMFKKGRLSYQGNNTFPLGFHLFDEFKQKENNNDVFLNKFFCSHMLGILVGPCWERLQEELVI